MTGRNAGSALWCVFTPIGQVESILLAFGARLFVLGGGPLAHRFALEMELVGRVQQAVENGVGQRWIGNRVEWLGSRLTAAATGAVLLGLLFSYLIVLGFWRTAGSNKCKQHDR